MSTAAGIPKGVIAVPERIGATGSGVIGILAEKMSAVDRNAQRKMNVRGAGTIRIKNEASVAIVRAESGASAKIKSGANADSARIKRSGIVRTGRIVRIARTDHKEAPDRSEEKESVRGGIVRISPDRIRIVLETGTDRIAIQNSNLAERINKA